MTPEQFCQLLTDIPTLYPLTPATNTINRLVLMQQQLQYELEQAGATNDEIREFVDLPAVPSWALRALAYRLLDMIEQAQDDARGDAFDRDRD